MSILKRFMPNNTISPGVRISEKDFSYRDTCPTNCYDGEKEAGLKIKAKVVKPNAEWVGEVEPFDWLAPTPIRIVTTFR